MNWLALLLLPAQISTSSIYYYKVHIKETRTKIAIIDTGIELNPTTKPYLCYGKHYDFTGTGIKDTHGHGTNIAGIIAKKIDPLKSCFVIIKYYSDHQVTPRSDVLFDAAFKENVKYINYSSGGRMIDPQERILIKELINRKVHVSVAAGNNKDYLAKNNCNYYPACYNFKNPYFHVVGNGKDGKPQMMSNYGEIVTDWRNGFRVEGFGIVLSGSSQSTAIKTGELAENK